VNANKLLHCLLFFLYQYIIIMENNLINTARSFFNEQSYQELASKENLQIDQVKRGIDTAIPSLFLGLQKKTGFDLQAILDKFKQHFVGFNFSDITHLWKDEESGSLPTGDSQNLLGSLFGRDLDNIVPHTASFLGLDQGTLHNLFKAGLPAVIGALTAKGTNWDATSIEADLNNNRPEFLKALPAGLPLNILGDSLSSTEHTLPVDSEIVTPVRETIVTPEEPAVDPVKNVLIEDPVISKSRTEPITPIPDERKKGGGLWWLLIPIILLILWFLFGKGCNREDAAPIVNDSHVDSLITENEVDSNLNLVDSETGVNNESIVVTLPNNVELNAYKGGIEDQLVMFLNSDYKGLSDDELKNRWFDFDNLNFETGTANILPESQVQLDNLIAILKAYPEVKIKVGGYTDKTGNEDVNLRISNERAMAVKTALNAQNVGDRVTETEGYGSEFAKSEASAPESDRIKDRRVAISVRK